MKVTERVLNALREATVDGPRLVLTGPRMDPRFYQQVNDVLEGVGGRWTKSAGAHIFPTEAAEAIAPVIATGHVVTLREKRNDAQYFPTPAAVVERLLKLASIEPGMEVLEPSAGSGAIATAMASRGAAVDCIERDPGYAATLIEAGFARAVRVADFVTIPVEAQYDRVVMNPPFTKGADIEHVQHALGFLKPGGLLVAVMSNAVTFHKGAAASFRTLVEDRGGHVEALPEGAFGESGTGVSTILVAIPATRPADVQPVVWPTREKPVAQEMEEFRDPAEIAREIADSLREAMNIMDDLARDLAGAARHETSVPAAVTDLPLPSSPSGQLAFEGLGGAS